MTRPTATTGYYAVRKSSGQGLALASPPSKPLAVDPKAMRVTAVISTPTPDRQGDILDPAGMETDSHRINPVVLFEHGKHPEFLLPIGKAEDSRGNYTVRVEGDCVVADTYFSQKSEFAEKVFQLYAEDILRGWSVGLDPDPAYTRRLNKGGRYHFGKWRLDEYSATGRPVNAEALTVAVEKSRASVRPLLLKSFGPHLLKSKPTLLVTKAMDDQDPMNDPMADPVGDPTGDPMAPESTPASGVPDTPPEAAMAYDGAQMLTDLAEQYRQLAAKSLHPKSRKVYARWAEQLDKMSQEKSSHAESVEGEINGGGEGGDNDGSDYGGPDDDGPDDSDEPLEKSQTGLIITKSGYVPKRYSFADLAKARQEAASARNEKDREELEHWRDLGDTYRKMLREMKRNG